MKSLGRATRRRAVPLVAVTTLAAGMTTGMMALPAHAAAGCSVTWTVSSQWDSGGGKGFQADVTIKNLGDAINGWTLSWDLPSGQTVGQVWNATVSTSGSRASATNIAWNGAIGTGGSSAFGLIGSSTGSAVSAPSSFTVNGTACTGGVSAPTTSAPATSAPATSAPPSTRPPTTQPPTTRPPTTQPPTTQPPTTQPPTSQPPTSQPPVTSGGKQLERLNRGIISVRSGSGNLVSWRLLATDAASTSFNLYRGGTKVNSSPITTSTNYLDSGAAAGASYTVRAVVNGTEQANSETSLSFSNGYLDVPISPPSGDYSANDASVGDVDGDGQYEIILKWDPSNSKDNSQAGVTGNVYIDAYRLSGERLWRIDLGRNIRAGAHYTQFQVYDYDGDGKAEVAMKTADGTKDGKGTVIGNANADYRNSDGYILSGPEYLTMFNGLTGAAMSTVNYDPPRGTVSSWGDAYGNRVDRFLAGTAYLDGARPSLIMARGYYTRTVIAAWDFRNGSLTKRWTFDTNTSGNGGYASQGDHQLSVADVDQDGKDEIIYGSMAVDDNGQKLWNTGNGHGDAMHVGDLDPSRPGLEEFKVDEDASKVTSWFADAKTGKVLWTTPASGDNGRGVSDDIWSGSPGAESWSAIPSGVRSPSGTVISNTKPSSTNFLSYWDGDTTRELLDGTHIDKWNGSSTTRLFTAAGVHANNGTKSVPSLSGDILGDWREEAIWPTTNNQALRIYSTPIQTARKFVTLVQDPMYRVAIAWQNTAYNQPPHLSYLPSAS